MKHKRPTKKKRKAEKGFPVQLIRNLPPEHRELVILGLRCLLVIAATQLFPAKILPPKSAGIVGRNTQKNKWNLRLINEEISKARTESKKDPIKHFTKVVLNSAYGKFCKPSRK